MKQESKPTITTEDQKRFIHEYTKVRPDYVEYAKFLEKVLQQAVDQLGYLGIVQARAKQVVSFSNKIILKDKYKEPLKEMTDLCGARVILHFQSQVEKICRFIKENFEIDEANSLDQKSKLKVNEFGYRSVHYVVTPKIDQILGEEVKEKFRSMKAEIQVRTLAEHIWADISHDRIYKTDLTIPEEWKREAARLMALLENADLSFAEMSKAIDAASHVYELQCMTEKSEKDIEKLKTLAEIFAKEPVEGARNVLKLVSVLRAQNMLTEASEILTAWIGKVNRFPELKARLEFEMVMLDLSAHCRNIQDTGYVRGVNRAFDLLETLGQTIPQEKPEDNAALSFLYYRFGSLLQGDSDRDDEALKMIGRAQELMTDNPLYFTAMLESVILRNIDIARQTIAMFSRTVKKAIDELEELISLGIDNLTGWFAIGRCHFFLGNRQECIKAYSRAVHILLNREYATSLSAVEAEISRAGRFKRFDRALAEQIRLYLTIAMAISEKCGEHEPYFAALENTQLRKKPLKQPVVIVAGGASYMDKGKAGQYRKYIEELMYGFKGTIFSGGTTAGIPGLVGNVKQELKKQGPVNFDLLAYLPEKLPKGVTRSKGYDHIYQLASNDFSALDVLTCWADMILLGIKPSKVILIGIDGGEIATMEYRIALSLGARVCLIAYSGRAVSDFIQEKGWKDHPNLIRVPNDSHTVWALVNQTTETVLAKDEVEKLAPLVHEFYRQEQLKKFKAGEKDINKYKVVMEWDKLDPALKLSNIWQVAFYEHILKRANLSIRKSDHPKIVNIKDIVSREDDYHLLAMLEHARWNAERLLEGWKYGPEKDLEKKLNPSLVSWEALDIETRKWDYGPVDNIPKMLAMIGYEIFNLSKP